MNQSEKRAFHPQESLFVLDSEHLEQTKSQLFGYAFVDDEIVDDLQALNGRIPGKEGAYVYLYREGNRLTITQDFLGCYGLYLYRKDAFFAVSNSFLLLAEHLRESGGMTLNREYADYLLSSDMCSSAYGETLVKEITVLDRRAELTIDTAQKTLQIRYADYRENTVDPDSAEGLAILDAWRNKWAGRIRRLTSVTDNIRTDLSGGFDSRLTLALFLSSGVDMNRVMVYSKNDKQKTHEEDYIIATEIAERCGFVLNNQAYISTEAIPLSLEDILEIQFYIKLGFHKQMYYNHNRMKETRYSFTGFSGGCIREEWHENEKETIDRAVRRCEMFSGITPQERESMEQSVRNVMERSFRLIRGKYQSFGREMPDQYHSQILYRDTRGRVHFGKSMVVQYMSNVITLSPMTDPDLHRLKLSSDACPDNNYLYALIMERYAPELLTFRFNSGRGILPETLEYARKRNRTDPFREEPREIQAVRRPPAEAKPEHSGDPVPAGVPDEVVRKAFHSPAFRNLFEKEYSTRMYNAVAADIAARTFYPMSVGYAAIAVMIILQDISVCSALHTAFSGYLKDQAEQYSKEQEKAALTAGPAGQGHQETPGVLIRAAGKAVRVLRGIRHRMKR